VAVTGREADLFADDVAARRKMLRVELAGARLLVIGGAGSIGSATVRALVEFQPSAIHVIDQNENKLADLIRDLRSDVELRINSEIRTFPLDYGSALVRQLIAEMPSYDYIFNFAALKHVRSEKDSFSLLRMLDTNVLKAADLLEWLFQKNANCRYFCVSTDKAANPVSLMGASKRMMEHVIFSSVVPGGARVTSARFANVAFSDGSLLDSFIKRLQAGRPLAAPRDTLRFFVSLKEAAQICLLAAVCAPNRHLLIPRLDPRDNLKDLGAVAERILAQFGFTPKIYSDEHEAKQNCAADIAKREYPLVLTARDTAGEKAFEEFVGSGESVCEFGLPHLAAVPYRAVESSILHDVLGRLKAMVSCAEVPLSVNEIAALLARAVPELQHATSSKNLDERL